MRIAKRGCFIPDDRGGVAVEFVALLPTFLLFTFFVFDIAIAMLWVGTVEKAAQLGARLAAVSDYAVTGLTGDKNQFAAGAEAGDDCSTGCEPFNEGEPLTCTGNDCVPERFNPIFTRMDAIASALEPENVTITYQYVGLGFAGGPIVPRVTITVQNVAYNTVTSDLLTGLYRLVTGDPEADFPGLTTMPRIEATFTGEDLASAGAS
jgi:hypothetical protein